MAFSRSVPPQEIPIVLIIDDDSTARLTLAAMLHREDRRIVFSANAAEVRGRLESIDPDVIVCDLIMEGMRGDELFRWLKSNERWRLTPIIAITQIDNPVVRADLLDAGADAVLSKKATTQEVRAYVEAALRTRNMYKTLCGRTLQLPEMP
ncbi:response regulator [Steroidobacter denitrificans]|uniref:response regulator n=1 Tax=Steroidobacter denitrificans TaxID=465721 RepID=UPI001AF010FF|nr:response regulator [Steroidobacter denitrificans]